MDNRTVIILAIDDNPDNLVVLKVLMSESFPQATYLSAQSGKSGIEICKTRKPDVVLLDIAMPEMDGYEVCSILKADDQLKHIPVVMLTATSVTARSRILALEAGADAFLAKPVDESELMAQILAMLRIKEAEDLKITENERLEILVQQRTLEMERELTVRKKTEGELQATVAALEKSRSAQLDLLSDLRNEISVRITAEEKVLSHLVEQRLISEVARKLVRARSRHEIYEYIGKRIFEVSGESYVFVTTLVDHNQSVKITHSFGLDKVIEKIKKTLGFDALKLEVMLSNLTDEEKIMYHSKELFQLTDKILYTLSARTVNETICMGIERILGIATLYTIAFAWEDQLFGSMVILCKKNNPLTKRKLIESLVNLASIAIQRLYAEEQLQKEHDNLTAILASSPVGMLVLDENEKIVRANPAASRIYYKDPDGKQNSKSGEFFGCVNSHENDQGCGFSSLCYACNIRASIKESLDKQLKIHDQEQKVIIETPNGQANAWLLFSTEPVLLNDKKHVILALHDDTQRRLAEEEKRKTENRYRSLIEHAPDGIVLIGTDGKFKFASTSAMRMFGFEQEDIHFTSPEELTHPEDLPRVLTEMGALINDPSYVPSLEYRFRKKDGSWRWIQSTFSNLLSDPSVEAIVINFRDVTERVDAEEALRISETKYHDLFEANKDGISIFYVDPETDTLSNFVEVNHAAAEMIGYTREEFLQLSVFQLEAGSDPLALMTRQQEIREKGFVSLETKIRHKNGRLLDIELLVIPIQYNNRIALMNIVRDISERKLAEDVLQEKEEQLSTLIDTTTDIICFKDGEGRWLRANNAMLEAFNLCDTDYQFKNDAELAPLTHEVYLESLLNCDDSNEKAWQNNGMIVVDEVIPSLSGENRTFEVAKTPLFHSDGSRKGLVVFGRDVTKRRQTENDLKESRQQLMDIIDFLPDATFVIDNEKRVIAWNKAMEEMTGINKESIIGQGDYAYSIPFYGKRQSLLLDLIDTEDEELKDRYFNVQRMGDSLHAEIYAPQLFNGKGAFIANVAAPLFDSKGKRVGSIESIRDITGRKQTEQIIENERLRLRTLIRTIPDCVWLKDPDGIYLLCNPTFEAFFGSSESEIIGKTDFDFESLEHAEAYRKRDKKVLESDKPVVYEEWVTRQSDQQQRLVETIKTRMYDSEGKLMGLLAVGRDITEVYKSHKSLLEREEIYSTIVNQANDAIVLVDIDTGEFMEFNEAAFTGLGYSREEFEILSVSDLEVANIPGQLNHSLNDLKQAGATVFETRHRAKSGEIRDVRISSRVITIREKDYLATIWSDITEKNLNEALLREKDLIFQSLLEYSPIHVFFKDHNIKTLHVSRNFEQMLGLPLKDIIGKDMNELFPADLAKSMIADDKRILKEGKLVEVDEELNGKSYTTIKFPILRENAPPMLAGFTIDVTGRKLAENALKESEEKYRSLIEVSQDAIFIDQGEKITYVNRAAIILFGARDPDQIIGKSPLELFHPDFHKLIQLRIKSLLGKSNTIPISEEKIIRFNGTVVDVEVSATAFSFKNGKAIQVVLRDITERKKAQEALKKSEANIRSLIENTTGSIWSIDQHFNLIDANTHFYSSMKSDAGYEISAGDNVLEILPSTLKKEWQGYYTRALKGEIFSIEVTTIPPLERQSMEYSFNPIITTDHQNIGVTVFGHNITAIKQAQREIGLLNAELEQRVDQRTLQIEQANKELESFSYSVSHDLRAPLRGIDGWSLALFEDYYEQLDEQGRVYIERVRGEAQRMGRLIDDLLKLSRVTRSEMKQVDVNLSDLAQNITNRLTEIYTGRQIRFSISPGLTTIGDPAMLEIVLTNLFDNACKFTGLQDVALIEFGKLETAGTPGYYIRDNGAGFDMGNAKNLFGAFQRMHKQTEFQGTGIGLATVQRIIHRHNGRIWAEAKMDEGAAFYFTLPFKNEK